MKSVMVHDFSRAASTQAQRSTFNRGHGLKTSFNSGYLVPVEVQEVLPGDEVKMDATFFTRLAPTVTPVMDNIFMDIHWFFVPSRILWNNFTKMMGERVNPNDSIDYLTPMMKAPSGGFAEGSLADYFGIPTKVDNLEVNHLPFRAYAKIWDDWYRDENLQNSIIQDSTYFDDAVKEGVDWNSLRKRGKRHDYFTSALPWPQRGDAVNLPLGGRAPVFGDGQPICFASAPIGLNETPQDMTGGYAYQNSSQSHIIGFDNQPLPAKIGNSGKKLGLVTEPGLKNTVIGGWQVDSTGMYADLTKATAATINSLRLAFQLQRLLEKDARCGTRFVEIIKAHFSTICPDARLQRSEYLGGSTAQIGFDVIAQTSQTTSETPQGNLVANGKVVCHSGFHKSFTEHGFIIGLASVRCDLTYQYGLNRMWSRKGRYDYFWPVLQNLGEQAVYNREIYAQGNSVDDLVFGYQERYAEYRYNPSLITGKMRSNATGSLDIWHLSQKFTSVPLLNADFIEENPPLSRVIAVPDEPELIMDAYLGQTWTRAMGTYAIPGLIDHL